MTRCGSYRDVHVTWIFQRRGWGQSGGGKIRGARKEFIKLTLRAFALHGQFASSTQLIKPICLGIPSPTQHHGFFRNLPIFFQYIKDRHIVLPHVPLPQSTPGWQQPDHN